MSGCRQKTEYNFMIFFNLLEIEVVFLGLQNSPLFQKKPDLNKISSLTWTNIRRARNIE